MIGLLLSLAGTLGSQAQASQPWAACKDFDHFVELVGREGAAYQTKAGEVIFLDDSAKETKRMKPPAGSRALFWSKEEGLVCAPDKPLTCISEPGARKLTYPYIAEFFAQREHVFVRMNGITFLGPGQSISCGPSYPGPFVAISADGTTFLALLQQMRPGLLYTYLHHGNRWDQSTQVISPEIETVGLCVPSRRDDLRMVGKSVVIYVGQFVGPGINEAKYSEFVKPLLDLRAFPFSKEPPSDARNNLHEGLPKRPIECFLFATDIGSCLTKGLAVFADWETGEPSANRLGQMTLSPDEQFLYIVAQDKILRLPIKEMVKKAGITND